MHPSSRGRVRHPNHPLLGLLQPLLVTNDETLERMAGMCYDSIIQNDLDESAKDVMELIFVDWLMQRFKGKNKQSIQAMLFDEEIDVVETRSDKEIRAIGKAQGSAESTAEAIKKVVKSRFSHINPKLQQRIVASKDNERLSEQIAQAATCS